SIALSQNFRPARFQVFFIHPGAISAAILDEETPALANDFAVIARNLPSRIRDDEIVSFGERAYLDRRFVQSKNLTHAVAVGELEHTLPLSQKQIQSNDDDADDRRDEQNYFQPEQKSFFTDLRFDLLLPAVELRVCGIDF